jgi:ATP-binding cassette, subfamily B, bacterial PglK
MLKKINSLLTKSDRRDILKLILLLILGVLFEILGLGALIPAIGLLLNPDLLTDYIPTSISNFLILNLGSNAIVYVGLLSMGFIYLVKSIFLIYLSWRQNVFSSNFTANLANDLFRGYLQMPYIFHTSRNTSVSLSMIQSEISSFSSVTQSFIHLFTEFTILVGILTTILFVFPLGTLFLIFFFGISVFLFYNFSKKQVNKWGKKRHSFLLEMNKILLQGFNGIKDLKIYGRTNFFSSKFSLFNLKSAKIFVKINTLNNVPRNFLELLAVTGLVGLLLIMVTLEMPLESMLPSIGIFVAAAFRVIPSINRIMIALQTIKFADISVDKLVNEFVLVKEKSLRPIKLFNKRDSFINSFEIANMSFSYKNNLNDSVHSNLNFTIKKGETVGIIGASGIGKSTLVDLLLGLFKPTEGNITIDGIEISKNRAVFYDLIGYVPQQIYLTDDTLSNNIAFGVKEKNIDLKRVRKCIKAAQLSEFVRSIDNGLNSIVGENGVKISGGQRQRIGIARALYNDPEILVLDEATSSLDSETEMEVMNSIYTMKGNLTKIIIAHRLSTLNNCNRIFELKKGSIIKEHNKF